ncbi:MAG TPA: hypothetical protein VFL96_08945 [Acidobacteriaceae bacterium]|nr:hypothetical protein [Acidobacteriaceae bacterium]
MSNDTGPLINPPPSHDTPLASLDGWTLTIACPKCGPHHKSISALRDELQERMRQEAHAAGGRPGLAAAKPLGDVLPHLVCETCSGKPDALYAVCKWIAKYQPAPPPIDLTALLQERPARGLREVAA